MIKNTQDTYGSVAKWMHWIIGILIIGMLALGIYMEDLPTNPLKHKLYGWHKQIGILILMLVSLRLVWRMLNVNPNLPPHMAAWEKFASKAVHYLLYILMFAMPLTGWIMSSAAGFPASFFGLFVMPDLVAPNEGLAEFLGETHEVLGYALIVLILGHAGAAIKHHFIDKDDVLRRML